MEAWFAARGMAPFAFQMEVWNAFLAGESGLIHAATGTGKTYAALFGPVLAALAADPPLAPLPSPPSSAGTRRPRRDRAEPLTLLWVTPLRALAADLEGALALPVRELGLPWSVERRTGDISAALRARQGNRLPTVLLTTPESLSVLLSRPEARELFASLRMAVVDEWHELLGTKRGTQTELALARLRRFCPELRTWGLSATLGNLGVALAALLGDRAGAGRVVRGAETKPVIVDSLLPATIERFPWAGHLAPRLLGPVAAAIDESGEGATCLVFTNTRSQCELWYQALLDERPDWAGRLALHHGSLDRKVREWVERALAAGELRAVVCTSSLDLGVDFTPVDRVLQVGSPKGIARLLQRAGRSGHRPGAVARVTCVPTHAFELVEVAAARAALAAGRIEAREPPAKPLDVLAQHLVTVRVGRRLPLGGAARRGADHPRLPRPERRRVGLGPRLRHPRRGGARELPRVPPAGRGRRRVRRSPSGRWRSATGWGSARSRATRRSRCSCCAAAGSARSRRRSSPASIPATASSSPAGCSSWSRCAA